MKISPMNQAEDLLSTQCDLATRLNAVTHLDEGLRLCLETAIKVSEMDCGGIYLVDDSSGALDLVFHKGLSSEFVKDVCHFDVDTPNTKRVMEGKSAYTQRKKLEVPLETAERHEELLGFVVLPVRHNNQVIGCINIASHTLGEVPMLCRPALEAISAQMGGTIARLRSEEALRESEDKFRSFAEQSLVGIYLISDDVFKYVNPKFAEIFGYSVDECLDNMHFPQLVHPEDLATVEKQVRRRLSGETKSVRYSFRGIKKNRETIHVEIFGASMVLKGKTVATGTMLDITDRKQAEEKKKQLQAQLQQAQKMEAMGTLAGGIAHDFNNLLMAIQGRTSIMLMKKDSSHPDIKYLKGIEDNVESAADLTRQLLGFARGGKYEVRPTDLNELIKKQNRMFGRTKKEITIRGKYEKDLWSVEVDRGQIEQVLLNLYVNAWQAMPGGGNLNLETENVTLDETEVKPFSIEPGRYVKISVTDTGVGMDKATQERIFEPFFTTKEMGRGTGLGLASVYGIIKNHGGFINVYSEKGHGSTFNIYLPASEKEVIEKKKSAGDTVRGSETVLFVDDEDMIIEIAEELFEQLGYKVLTARSGKEALEIYHENKEQIDIVLLDMIMPDMSGSDTYDRMKKIDPDIKVLLSSGYSINGRATEILDRGCNGFIQKPFKMKELSQKLREILDS